MPVEPHILVIDDDEAMRDSCIQILSREEYTVFTAEDGKTGLKKAQEHAFDVIILDLKLPDIDGMAILKQIIEDVPAAVVVVITGYPTVESAVDSMKAGAYDFIPKPFTPDTLRVIIQKAIAKRKLLIENLGLRKELSEHSKYNKIVGCSDAMQNVMKLIEKVAPTDSTVLISGESGTGKELVAKAIHQRSSRCEAPLMTVDCSTLVESLFESELFGHVKGAFTGATVTKHGRFELANDGTLFFDEIGNISVNIQAKLLRAIQEREITKVGSSHTIKIDVRIIAATNRDLLSAVKEGKFREDLYYRLSVFPIHLPPLRERKEDIPLLANYFLERYNEKRKKNIRKISQNAINALCDYDWPGNVRELENTIERAIILTETSLIKEDDLFYNRITNEADTVSDSSNIKTLEQIEKEHIKKTLEKLDWNKSKTAELLNVDRKTIRTKIRKYNIRKKENI